jgi:hypothetical protein
MKEFVGANILGCEVYHNGYQGGDAGHGGYVTIHFKDICSTSMMLNGKYVEEFKFTFQGDSERDTLINALEYISHELKKDQRK